MTQMTVSLATSL